jgi:hypothetical protein
MGKSSSSEEDGGPIEACKLSMAAGKYKLEYDFYSSADGKYTFPDSTAYVLVTEAGDGGKGVMLVKYCFAGDQSRDMVMVQTGFSKLNTFPFKLAKFEDTDTVQAIYNEYSLLGEYSCDYGSVMVGFTSHFEGNAFTAKVSEKDDGLNLDADGCLIAA